MKLRFGITTVLLAAVTAGCGNNVPPQQPSAPDIPRVAALDSADDSKPDLVKAGDDVKLVDLPKGSRVGFGRVLKLPKPPVVLKKQESSPGHFRQTFVVTYIEVIEGNLYHQLDQPDDTSYTTLETQ